MAGGASDELQVLPSDAKLRPVAEKVLARDRLSREEGLVLYRSTDLLGIGALADLVNRRQHDDRVFFVANQHINPTNVCVMRSTCTFCSYARRPGEEGAYTMTVEEALSEAERGRAVGVREFHVVGGLHPKLRLQYYLDLIRGLKERHPGAAVKALTAVEIAHLARLEQVGVEDVLSALRHAGLDSIPGGGAEVFSVAVRSSIAARKLAAEEWLAVHRIAHGFGIPSNCTMLYGHVETEADRVAHLYLLRELQDETQGFLAFIPLAYHPAGNALGRRIGANRSATTGFDDLKNLAIGRLFLDNIPHIKTHWVMHTPQLSQVSLHFGVNDVEGTMVREKVYHEAGATTPQAMTPAAIAELITDAGRRPVERDANYREIGD